LLELLVQDDPLRAHYVLIPAHIPLDIPETLIESAQLPADWRSIAARAALN